MNVLNNILLIVPHNAADLCAQELEHRGGPSAQYIGHRGNVLFAKGDLETAYRMCLWSRVASRVLWQLDTRACAWTGESDRLGDALYEGALKFPWHEALTQNIPYALSITSPIPRANLLYLRQRLKDAVSDSFRARGEEAPPTDPKDPALRFAVHLETVRQDNDSRADAPNHGSRDLNLKLTLYLDLAGESLHRRRQDRQQSGFKIKKQRGSSSTDEQTAPLKESLAAIMLLRAQLAPPASQSAHPPPIVDPMCGSGTLLLEALGIILNVAPGMEREGLARSPWSGHDPSLWQSLLNEAQTIRKANEERLLQHAPLVFGFDNDSAQILRTKRALSYAGWTEFASIEERSLKNLQLPKALEQNAETGLVVCNPPYGERLLSPAEIPALYRLLGQRLEQNFAGWDAVLLLPAESTDTMADSDPKACAQHWSDFIGLPLLRQHTAKNGALDCSILRLKPIVGHTALRGEDFYNRLRKRYKQLSGFIKKEALSCYRLYDRDLPEYNACIDIYGDAVHVQVFAPPQTVSRQRAAARVRDILDALNTKELSSLLGINSSRIFFKQRRRQRGRTQYIKQGRQHGPQARNTEQSRSALSPPDHHNFTVTEHEHTFEVNLADYLDTGLFIDHRLTRALIQEHSAQKTFLNIFCYTASASVYAARGGAVSSESWDMSRTYLNWAKRNFEHNGMSLKHHLLHQVDCIAELKHCRDTFDFIFVDPPTFSNSKRMPKPFEIQTDHVELLNLCGTRLTPGGRILFSNNLKNFSLDYSALEKRFTIEDITQKTTPKDFDRRAPHQAYWLIRR